MAGQVTVRISGNLSLGRDALEVVKAAIHELYLANQTAADNSSSAEALIEFTSTDNMSWSFLNTTLMEMENEVVLEKPDTTE